MTTRLICRVAVDCDYEYYANRFGGDLIGSLHYALVIFATASFIYERDLNVALRIHS